jgi:hypothetical protein
LSGGLIARQIIASAQLLVMRMSITASRKRSSR